MARKTVSIKRAQEEAAAAEAEKKTKKKAKKKATRKKAKAKAAEVRLKVCWGVFNQSMKRVALYSFDQKKAAEKKATDLSASGKSIHFVQKVKEEVPVE